MQTAVLDEPGHSLLSPLRRGPAPPVSSAVLEGGLLEGIDMPEFAGVLLTFYTFGELSFSVFLVLRLTPVPVRKQKRALNSIVWRQ